jgi:hypothetical protein
MSDATTFVIVKDGGGHRVVAPLVGDTVKELEEQAILAVDRAIDAHVARRGFTGRIVIAFKELPADDADAERARIAALLQARADAFGGVTVFGSKLVVTVTVGLNDPVDPPLAPAAAPEPPSRSAELGFDPLLREGFTVRDQAPSPARESMKALAAIAACLTLVLLFTTEQRYALVPAGCFVILLVALVFAVRTRELRIYSDRLEVDSRTIRYADVDAFMFKTSPIPGRLILTKKDILIRYRPSRGGTIAGNDGELYDEAIEGDFVPMGSLALVVALNFRLERFREARNGA